ncbi:sel1 repeat family protein [Pseudomonas syringae pv. syringae]|uniref:SEL1-like repeat protein n=1 Tax=Pseudomonas syringae TaxID=317 RepID=UPI0013C35415|nr:sel1 repeat family protein [Pseudomonas syringae]MCH5551887.1 sel1 repeat family protein [Pseudomonas syringae pv. syringae]
MKRKLIILYVLLLLTACSKKDEEMPSKSQIDFAYERLKFQCAHESDALQKPNDNADILYKYALFLEKQKKEKDYDQIAKFYRISAAHDHYKSATNLQNLLSSGRAKSPDPRKETIDLVEKYISQNVPGAYYDMGHYLEIGYGVKKDISSSRAYFRRAADLGNPDAQYYIAELLTKVPNTADIMQSMYKCAMEQGHSMAGRRYASYASVTNGYKDAVAGYQLSTKNGDNISARLLARGFEGPEPSDEFYYLALDKDEERVARYDKISSFLVRHEHLGAKIPDLDDIVPLPPAPLPEWDGTFKWKRDRDSAAPPSPPSEELIQRMAAEKNLDPETGLPLPASK